MQTSNGLSADQFAEIIRQGQQAFRRNLAGEAADSAQRLQVAYSNVLDQLNGRLKDFNVLAGEDGMTPSQLASEAAVVRLRDATQEALNGMSSEIEREARKLQDSGAVDGAKMAGLSLRAAGMSGGFAQPSVAQIQSLINYVDGAPFQKNLENYGEYHAQAVADIILNGASQGKGPNSIARQVSAYITDFPLADATRQVRTVQLWSARRGQQATFQANRDVVPGWIWSSAKDLRTCPSCWAMDGQFFPVDEILNDHHMGRCAMVPVTNSWASMGFDGGQEVTAGLPTGLDVFNGLAEDDQQHILGKARWMAFKDGLFTFDQLSTTYLSAVYGEMRGEASLDEIIGPDAAKLYKKAA